LHWVYRLGRFKYFTTVFTNNSDEVIVYPDKSASYTVQSPVTILSNTPPPGKIICIRFYDRSFTGPSARYTTVTGPDWVWPSYSSGIPTNLYLKIASSSNSGWKTGNIFEVQEHGRSVNRSIITEPNEDMDRIRSAVKICKERAL